MGYAIKNVISSKYVPQWGNQKKFIAIHYLGVVGQNHELQSDGCGAHFYIYWDGTIYQRCSLDAVVWAVGTAGYYAQKHPQARNANTISIEMCCKCDGDSTNAEDKKWYFTTETQEACAWLVRKLMKEQGIPAENVLRHYDIVNKTCPAPYVHNNKYKTSWTWDEFKAEIGSSGASSQDIRDVRIGDSTVNEISKVVYNEAGVIQSYDALVAVAQCIKDMTDNGGYGKGITDVMERNFYAYGQDATTEESRQAVYDVFVGGKRRFADAVILQFRSFTNYSDGAGNMDKNKCASLLDKYEYLGKDARDNHWGHFYFGHKVAAADPAPEAAQPTQPATTTKATNKVIAACKVFQKQLKADIEAGKQWTYHNPSKYLEEQWSKALKNGKRSCNCALLARWALKEAGLIPQDTGIFYGKSDGTISWSTATKKAVEKACDVIRIGDRTVDQLIKDGTLKAGDIVTYAGFQHTNIYAGNNKWYDAGHAYCEGSGEGAAYRSWHGKTVYGSYKVAYIIREKGTSNTTTTKGSYIVQAGSFSVKANATKQMNAVRKAGFDAIVKQEAGRYKVQCGVFEVKANADALVVKMNAAGFEAIIKTI